jgi:hypothetical protein
MSITLPEVYKIVQLANPQTTNGGFTSDYVSLKNVKRATIIVELTQAVAHATAISINQATVVAGTDAKVLTNEALIWANEDVAASDTLVAKTDAKNYTVAADIKNKQIIFQIDPASCMDINNDFDCISVTSANSAQATNFASVTALLEMKYQQATPPASITD